MQGKAIVTIGGKQWRVSLATTYQEVTRGLGGIDAIPAGTGMLFDMGYDHIISVTTAFMRFPLDIAFISGDLRIAEVAADVAPGLLVTSDIPVRYFMETNAEEMAQVMVGDAVDIQVTASPAQTDDLTGEVVNWGLAMLMMALAGRLMNAVLQSPIRHEAKPEIYQPALLPAPEKVAEAESREEDRLEYLADTPEYLASTIDAIGYRQLLDIAFQEAIRRARSRRQSG